MASIEIKTVQNVAIRYELGTFGERMISTMIDWFVIGFSSVCIYLLSNYFGNNSNEKDTVVFTIVFTLFIFYSLVNEYFMSGSSPGKRLMGLRIMRVDGQPCEILDYVIRWAFRSVDIFLSVGAGVGLLVGFTPTRQRIGEILSNTVVVKFYRRENSVAQLLKLKSISNYTPGFQQSSRISENEAILIKEVLDKSKQFPTPGHKKAVHDLSLILSRKLEIPTQQIVDDHNFLLTVLKDYVAFSR